MSLLGQLGLGLVFRVRVSIAFDAFIHLYSFDRRENSAYALYNENSA